VSANAPRVRRGAVCGAGGLRPAITLGAVETSARTAAVVFRHACKLELEGIVSKRLGSPYRAGRSRHWVKSKNPDAPAVKREAEEDWGQREMAITWGKMPFVSGIKLDKGQSRRLK